MMSGGMKMGATNPPSTTQGGSPKAEGMMNHEMMDHQTMQARMDMMQMMMDQMLQHQDAQFEPKPGK
jgi:hypothetical protein